MKTAIIGSRTITDYEALKQALQGELITEVVSGGASGVDAMAEQWAREHNKPVTIIKPDYARYGKAAPMVRNSEIIKMAAKLIAFWDGESKGTLATVNMAKKAGKVVRVVLVKKPDKVQMGLF
jgi:predicted Rossmann fold nucleotide-binding protein DprA/Smf involved in DNA uptake